MERCSKNGKRKIEKSVKDLSVFLSLFPPTTSPFPCMRFGFIGGKCDHEVVRNFFSKYAGRIKELCLDWDEEDNFLEDCRDEFPENWTVDQTLVELILSNKLTRLESLEIYDFFMNWSQDWNLGSTLGLRLFSRIQSQLGLTSTPKIAQRAHCLL